MEDSLTSVNGDGAHDYAKDIKCVEDCVKVQNSAENEAISTFESDKAIAEPMDIDNVENGDDEARRDSDNSATNKTENEADFKTVFKPDNESVTDGNDAEKLLEVSVLDKLWEPVKLDSSNFSAWTKLIQHAESNCDVGDIRRVLDAFLERYPFCYGYWKKYSDIEKNRGTPELCSAVFERGLTAIPLSVDLWLHYIGYIRSVHAKATTATAELGRQNNDSASGDKTGLADSAAVREAFERATHNCGLEFRCDRLWEQYYSWEASEGDLRRVLSIYRRTLAVPTLSYRTHMDNLQFLVSSQAPRDLLTIDQLIVARAAIIDKQRADKLAAVATVEPTASSEVTGEVTGEVAAGVIDGSRDVDEGVSVREAIAAVDGVSQAAAGVDDLLPPGCDEPPDNVDITLVPHSDEETSLLRDHILAPLRTLHKETEREVSLRWTFEEAIRRPYFHVKPLERSQLNNWRAYLDFEVEQGDAERTRVLFERCLIACACYEQFWIKYVVYLESRQPAVDCTLTRTVLQQACRTHLPDRPALLLLWASFEERHGDAVRAYDIVDDACSRLRFLELFQRRVNIARRRGDLTQARLAYQHAIDKLLDDDTDGGDAAGCHNDGARAADRRLAEMIAVKYVRFMMMVKDDDAGCEAVLRELLRRLPGCQRLYVQLLELSCRRQPVDVATALEAFRLALGAPLALRQRVMFAHRRVEFLDDFGDNVQCVREAQQEHAQLVRQLQDEESSDCGRTPYITDTADQASDLVGKRQTDHLTAADMGNGGSGSDKRARTSTGGCQVIPTVTPTSLRAVPPASPRYQPPTAAYSYMHAPPPPSGTAAGVGGYYQQQQPSTVAPPSGGGAYYAGGWYQQPQQYDYSQYAAAYSQYGGQYQQYHQQQQ